MLTVVQTVMLDNAIAQTLALYAAGSFTAYSARIDSETGEVVRPAYWEFHPMDVAVDYVDWKAIPESDHSTADAYMRERLAHIFQPC